MQMSSAQRRVLFRHPAGWIATGFGSGLSPFAPGTAGSVAALLPWLGLRELPLPFYAIALVLAFALGVWACNWIVGTLSIADPGIAVWDEFVGQWIALTPLFWLAPPWSKHGCWWIFAGFLLFRIFDVWKPWPVSWADRSIGGGLGVMLDDVIAGFYAAIVLALLQRSL
ncbi:MAG: phosphatidylglycerophosphatase A [Rudaea sp.]|nr:phosphatidylglycerophosphatase A [Rudaea sp.]